MLILLLFVQLVNIHQPFGIDGKYGILLDKQYYIINYSTEWKIPYWTSYVLTSKFLEGRSKRDNVFRQDTMLDVIYRSKNSDYDETGYDKGHNSPADDFKRSDKAMEMTFLLSNMSPQLPGMNRGVWKSIEKWTRSLAIRDGIVWVTTGNIVSSDSVIGNGVSVPSHCFKVVISLNYELQWKMFVFLVPNSYPLGVRKDYQITVDSLEKFTGYDFFPLMEDDLEDSLERILFE